MKKKTIQIDLNTKRYGIDKAIKALQSYKKDLVEKQCAKFCEKLIQRGIKVSVVNCGDYGRYIEFDCIPKEKTDSKVTFLYTASKTQDITVTWKTKDGEKSEDIDPLLMAEFGSGWLAINKWNYSGAGQGTHPQQTHAFDPDGWWWTDDTGTHHSYGQMPTFPIHLAWLEMQQSINAVVKEVYK